MSSIPVQESTDVRVARLTETARRIRKDIIRMTTHAGSGHPAPSFSVADIVTVLYFSEMRRAANDPSPDEDLFVLSKGHAAPALYAALYEGGFITEEAMLSLRQPGSPLQGHPDGRMKNVDATSGSLGIGLSQAVGRAYGARLRGSARRVFAVVGDGELQEGQIWEAALAAAQLKLDNLIAFVDLNGYQVGGLVRDVINIEPVADKWRAFGWRAEEVDGHDFDSMLGFLARSREAHGQPQIAIARTEKGHGVSFLAGGNNYHAEVLKPDEAERAIAELDAAAVR